MTSHLRADLALDAGAVLDLAASAVERVAGFWPVACRIDVIKQNRKRVVARYDFDGAGDAVTVAGKWYSTDRGSLVAAKLDALRGTVEVPEVVQYFPDVQALFVEWIDGPLLRDVVGHRGGTAAARGTGRWLAHFHASDLRSPRRCGPAKQRGSVERWAHEQPGLQPFAGRLDEALGGLADPHLPVHYDFYHQQVITPAGAAPVVIDLDETGRGDPAFDVEHFRAHLALLGLVQRGDPAAFARDGAAFEAGYRSVAATLPESPVLGAFAWYKLLYQALHRGSDEAIVRYAGDALRGMLDAA